MPTLSELVSAQGRSSADDIEWLHRLAGDGQLLADLAFADIVFWGPTKDDSFIAVAHTRPSWSIIGLCGPVTPLPIAIAVP